jgi:hypothetical protein
MSLGTFETATSCIKAIINNEKFDQDYGLTRMPSLSVFTTIIDSYFMDVLRL